MELAWNTQKNQLSDVKGKEMEQERKGKIRNEEIDLSRTKNNYDIVSSDKNLYQRVKERVDELKKSGSRVQKNSVVMYSNILTVPSEQAKEWGEQKTDTYFKACYDFFCEEFGKENVVSGKVHKDETAPHMHLHFVPVNKETGKLQARVAMNRKRMNEIHNDLPAFLRERGFDVVRGSGRTNEKNIKDIHEFKQAKKAIAELEQSKKQIEQEISHLNQTNKSSREEFDEMSRILSKDDTGIDFLRKEIKTEVIQKKIGNSVVRELETENYVLTPSQYEQATEKIHAAESILQHYKKLRDTDIARENHNLRQYIQQTAKPELKKQKIEIDSWKKAYEASESDKQQIQMQNKELKKENMHLKDYISDLREDMAIVYKSIKSFLKQRTEGLNAFKEAFSDLTMEVRYRTKKVAEVMFDSNRKNEFEKIHRQEISKDKNRGLDR